MECNRGRNPPARALAKKVGNGHEYTADEVIQYVQEETSSSSAWPSATCTAGRKTSLSCRKNCPGPSPGGWTPPPWRASAGRCAPTSSCAGPLHPHRAALAPGERPGGAHVLRHHLPGRRAFPADSRRCLKPPWKPPPRPATASPSVQRWSLPFSDRRTGRPTKEPYDRAGYMDIAPETRAKTSAGKSA